MCGLFGVVQRGAFSESSIERARAARDTLWHRGPDQAGEYCVGSAYLGHRRLSIMDTSDAGRQPMVAGDVAVTVNGEIYNFLALRGELERAGYVFRSHSDSEVVLHGYRHWGVDGLVERLDGMYAAVIHDVAAVRLFAFRDRVGIKPFYYYLGDGQLVWASELKAIKAFLPTDALELDAEALLDFLVYRYIPAPKALYRNTFKLPAASILECNLSNLSVRVRRYWQLLAEVGDTSQRGQEERLLELLEASVCEQLVSDVPLGLLLSGGIDSSAVAAVAGRYQPHIRSFSIGFKQKGRDETPYARLMAAHAGTEHHEYYLEDEEMAGLFDRMHGWFDEPFGDTSAVPTHRVCGFAREQVKVALSGDGGDELFGGYLWYPRYSSARTRGRWMPIKSGKGIQFPARMPKARELEWASISDPVWLYALIRGSVPHSRLQEWRERLGIPADYDPLWAYRTSFQAELPARKAAQVMDFHTYLPDNILTKVDRVSMALSLECRPPLLSRALVDFAFSLPEDFLYRDGGLKGGFKHALRAVLPLAVLEHRKQGFSVPDSGWRRALVSRYGSLQEGMLNRYLSNKG
jgi:asparagine synthase (glutamine-hydrolysing)